MGTWGFGSFDNDDAADFVGDLMDQGGIRPVHDAIGRALDARSYFEAPEAQQALAACEVVAALAGNGRVAQFQVDLEAWIAHTKPAADPVLRSDAVKAVDRVLAENSELRELWEESGDFAEWQEQVLDLRQRLQSPQS